MSRWQQVPSQSAAVRVEDWPGVHCAVPLLTGAPVAGTWFDRSLEYNAFLRRKELEKGESQIREEVVLSPLPCWQHLELYRARLAENSSRDG